MRCCKTKVLQQRFLICNFRFWLSRRLDADTKAFSLGRRWQPKGLTDAGRFALHWYRWYDPDYCIPTSVKNQRFLTASPQGEAFWVRNLNRTINRNSHSKKPGCAFEHTQVFYQLLRILSYWEYPGESHHRSIFAIHRANGAVDIDLVHCDDQQGLAFAADRQNSAVQAIAIRATDLSPLSSKKAGADRRANSLTSYQVLILRI